MEYSLKDLISFGNYILSPERMERVKWNEYVHDADIKNWLEESKKLKKQLVRKKKIQDILS